MMPEHRTGSREELQAARAELAQLEAESLAACSRTAGSFSPITSCSGSRTHAARVLGARARRVPVGDWRLEHRAHRCSTRRSGRRARRPSRAAARRRRKAMVGAVPPSSMRSISSTVMSALPDDG